ncbi:hypothetical protein [Mesorhizobium silamurunense]|uniref:hypothetical protein n=1 Tax=Mesorhizobium silamurunense TaxID=499528 RepID=UPI00177ED958|nr:hypothetical protein [Mesorhizobium silamurunense]
MDLRLLERIAEAGGPAVQTCRANQATVIFKVQLGQGVTLAEESYARTVTIDSATWKPLMAITVSAQSELSGSKYRSPAWAL